MSANLTDSGTFTNPIVAPADGDAANGTTFQAGLQGLANRTRYNKNRIDKLFGGVAKYTFAASPTADAYITLTEAIDPNGIGAIVSNQVEVVEAGIYRVSLTIEGTNASASANTVMGIELRVGGTRELRATTVRATASASQPMTIAAGTVLNITTPASQRIGVYNPDIIGVPLAGRYDAITSGSSLTIERIG